MENTVQKTIRVNQSLILPDNNQWQFRFEVKSASSNRIYVIAQNKKRKHWACSCPGWKRHRKCKHLSAIGVPNKEVPFDAKIAGY